jgi:hypothetical protein
MTETSSRRHLWVSRGVAVVLAGLVVAVVVGLAVQGVRWMRSGGGVSAQTTGYSVVSDTSIAVDFSVSAPRNSTVICQVRAQASDGLDVGVADVSVVMQGQTRRNERITVATRRAANKGQVVSCRAA